MTSATTTVTAGGRGFGKQAAADQILLDRLGWGDKVQMHCPSPQHADKTYARVLALIKGSDLTIEGNQLSKREVWTHSWSGKGGVVRVTCPKKGTDL